MTLVTNNFEGGTNTTALSQGSGGNTGGVSGNFFDNVIPSTDGVITFSNVQMRDLMACRISTGSTGSTGYIGWAVGSIGALTDWYGRLYFYVNAVTNTGWSQARWIEIRSSAALAFFIRPNTATNAHKIEIAATAGSIVSTGTHNVVGNSWYRIEWHATHSTTVGALEVRLWSSPDSAGAQTDTISMTSQNLGAALDNVRLGCTTSQQNFPTVTAQSAFLYIDNVVVGASNWPGPAVAAAANPRPIMIGDRVVRDSFVL